MTFDPQRTVFVLLSFEGPDVYSRAGGLGVRVKGLSRSLARMGYLTYVEFATQRQAVKVPVERSVGGKPAARTLRSLKTK